MRPVRNHEHAVSEHVGDSGSRHSNEERTTHEQRSCSISNGVRFHSPLFALLLLVGSLAVPVVAHAQGIPFFGPIIPEATNQCAAGWGMLMVVVNRVISLLITLAIVFVAPLMIAYSGFLFVVNPVSSAGKEQAKGILTHTIVGIVIALAGWMIVNAIMAVLYDKDKFGETWSSLITSDGLPPCLDLKASLNQSAGIGISGISASGVKYLAPVSGNCSTDSLISFGIDPSIANTMSCIAQNESSCNLTAANSSSSAFGLFQVVNGYNDTGHNLNFPVCTQAAQTAGYSVSGNLDCHNSVIRGGAPNPNNIYLYNACHAASSNPNCNAAAAQWLYTNRGGYKNWVVAPKCGV